MTLPMASFTGILDKERSPGLFLLLGERVFSTFFKICFCSYKRKLKANDYQKGEHTFVSLSSGSFPSITC